MSEKRNDKLQEAINEAVLKAAFTEAAERELAELEAMDIEVPQPTEKQRKEIEKAIRGTSRTQKRGISRAWRAVAMFAIFFCVAASIIMIQPTVRASVWDFIVSVYEKYLSFDFDEEEANASFALGQYTITYIPECYEGEDTQANPLKSKAVFSNGRDSITVTCYPTEINAFLLDYEQAEKEKLFIGQYEGYCIRQTDTNTKWLIWGDSSKTFVLIATLSDKEILKVAENIK